MNLPNKITLSRILILPVIMFFYLTNLIGPIGKLIALILFLVAAVTDFLDGYIARKYNLVTDLGKFLDPIADKILSTVGVVLIIADSNPALGVPYGIIFISIMLFRDYAVTALRQLAQTKGVIIHADMLGKIKANFIYLTVALGMLIAYLTDLNTIRPEFLNIANIALYAVAALTTLLIIVSGVRYIVKNASVFKNNKPNAEV